MVGISSYCYGWAVGEGKMDALALLDTAAARGFGLVQLSDHLSLDTLGRQALENIRRHADALHLVLEVGMRTMTRENVEEYLRVCDVLDASLLRVVVDGPRYFPAREDILKILSGISARLHAQGVMLAIENHDRFGSYALAEIVRDADDPCIGICLDTVNSMGAGEGVDTVLEHLLPLTVNVHLKDFAVTRLAHLQGFCVEGRPLGEGILPVESMLERLRIAKQNVNVLLELWTPPEDTMEATLAKEAAWAKQSMERLLAFSKLI